MPNSEDLGTSRVLRLAIVSDLHYRDHGDGKECRPAASAQGVEYDPIAALIEHVKNSPGDAQWRADYLLCPGDIPDRADENAFRIGWERLRALMGALGARHLIAATGNHEVISRADDKLHGLAGNAELSLDPLGYLQSYEDYPSSVWNGLDRRWVYWGRGYEFIEDGNLLLLLINSSHFHPTTRENEFERGRIGDVGIRELRVEIARKIAETKAGAFVVLLHHHPISHESLDFSLGRIEMFNGSKLVEVLSESGVSWLIVHGHKHHGRLVMTQGDGCQSVVLAAGSSGAMLSGGQGMRTRLQAYLVEMDLADPKGSPRLQGRVHALSWIDNAWAPATDHSHGIPDGCGFAIPMVNAAEAARASGAYLSDNALEFLSWIELTKAVPQLANLMPGQLKYLRSELDRIGIKSTWPSGKYFPEDVAP